MSLDTMAVSAALAYADGGVTPFDGYLDCYVHQALPNILVHVLANDKAAWLFEDFLKNHGAEAHINPNDDTEVLQLVP
ncbi:hypothetical protein HNQ50_000806 [Silvimonas terrae]|uniref:Uncharacterized protein n=1 Tax=Silvimonas terrae TaxID=300266 RepID=A0A840RCE1_9NEIS|nr:hypothetical protein [Silvimonas terrae]MBB5190096.1 hypothetical protein [Silvimonas terrae]